MSKLHRVLYLFISEEMYPIRTCEGWYVAGDRYRYLFVLFWYSFVSRVWLVRNRGPLKISMSRNIPEVALMVPVVFIVGYTSLNFAL